MPLVPTLMRTVGGVKAGDALLEQAGVLIQILGPAIGEDHRALMVVYAVSSN